MSDQLTKITLSPDAIAKITLQMSLLTYETLVKTQQQHPQWLLEKYQSVDWQAGANKTLFLERLQASLTQKFHQGLVFPTLEKFLHLLLKPDFFQSNLFQDYHSKVHEPFSAQLSENSSEMPIATTRSRDAIAILLLDAENLQLDAQIEKVLSNVCEYPLQIKIAFGNWRNLGKLDVELHNRGYELIHVPAGKDSADIKMATVGTSIFIHYPTARAVFVCSSDRVMSHLVTTLQTHGLTVYLVRRQGDNLTIFNSVTHQIKTLSLKATISIPTLPELIKKLKKILKEEQQKSSQTWIALNHLTHSFDSQSQLSLQQILTSYNLSQGLTELLAQYPQTFALHQVKENQQMYVSLFEITPSIATEIPPNSIPTAKITSALELEQALFGIVRNLTHNQPNTLVEISKLPNAFTAKYGIQLNVLMKELNLDKKFLKFLQSCSKFKLQKFENIWKVGCKSGK